MKIIDENNVEMEVVDLFKGYLKDDVIIEQHEAVEGVKEIGHYETIAEYPNGGKDVRWVVDVPGVETVEAWEEEIPVQRYIQYTEEELAEREANRKPTHAERLERLEKGMELLLAACGISLE